ncbi:hypothetical protein [Nocardia asteroides]|uniref:hypothetical protein n=1 Tax=Nocardia asteroides TaxID=1824 RepID=UPI001E529C19|nr:hypothetical protein [Nocardia asteroides]UGT58367.1 hypothetical protein LTT85_16645 [Nocardia asteroides]
MGDISFPARLRAYRQPDIDGLPLLTAEVELAPEVAELPLPGGPAGAPGSGGRPRTSFRKMGVLTNSAARPSGLGLEDRGKWWHRLDDNGMDVWIGDGWVHSVDAVGPAGPAAAANVLTVLETMNEPALTEPALELVGTSAEQEIRATVPAGLRGPVGPPGDSGTITEAEDYEEANGPSHGGVFAYDRASRRFRSVPAPLGAGPWGWYQEDFAEEQIVAASRVGGGTFTIPAQPFRWRPHVYGHIYVHSNTTSQAAELTVRLGSSQGPIVATGTAFAVGSPGAWMYVPVFPCLRDGTTARVLSPTSDFATVPAGQPGSLVVSVERIGTGPSSDKIGISPTRASLIAFAEPTE